MGALPGQEQERAFANPFHLSYVQLTRALFKKRARMMGSSGDAPNAVGYVAGATFAHGKPDITWHVNEGVMRAVFAAWKDLRPHPAGPPSAPASGYSGCFLRFSPEVEFFIYAGVATLMTPSHSESRSDADRAVERFLVDTAPAAVPRINPTNSSPS